MCTELIGCERRTLTSGAGAAVGGDGAVVLLRLQDRCPRRHKSYSTGCGAVSGPRALIAAGTSLGMARCRKSGVAWLFASLRTQTQRLRGLGNWQIISVWNLTCPAVRMNLF